jgi:transposase-like protein
MPIKLAARVKGLSESGFRAAFGTEQQCRAVLERLRWPRGFICPRCGHGSRAWLAERRRYQCNRCKHQVSLTAGTIFHATKLPLTTWFLAIHLIVSAKNGISSVELGRRLGVKQTTAWSMKQKIMQVMREREAATPLQGRVEIDDAYLGGARSGGKRGRGAAGKTPVVAAVETTPERRPKKLQLLPVKGFRKKEVEKLAREHLVPETTVVSDGLSCWAAVASAGCRHFPMVTGSGRQAARWAPFKWVNTTLGNIKAAIGGTYRQLGPAHAPRYLASFAWRFNRRFQLDSMLVRFVHSAARTQPLPHRLLVAG